MESAAGEGYIIAPKQGKLVEAEGEEVPELSELKCMDLELAPLTLRVDATSPAAAQCKEGEVVLRGTGEIQERYGLQVGDVVLLAKLKASGQLVLGGHPGVPAEDRPAAAGTNAAERAKQEAAALDGGAAGGTTGGTQRTKKRKMMAGTSLPANAVSDGIFRAAPPGTQVNPKEAVVPVEGLWSVMVDLEGEAYQAFFDTPEDAHLALVATGHSPIDA